MRKHWVDYITGFGTLAAALAAAAAAIYAAKQANVSTDTEYRQLRAYVSVRNNGDFSHGAEKGVGDGGKTVTYLSFEALVSNLGQTPAYNVTVKQKLFVNASPWGEIDPYRALKADRILGTLGPGQKVEIPSSYEATKMVDGKPRYMVGVVEYEDVFARWHVAPYCIRISLEPEIVGDQKVSLYVIDCAEAEGPQREVEVLK